MATSTIKRSLGREIKTATITTSTAGEGQINITEIVGADAIVLSATPTNNEALMCIPWKYNNYLWFVHCLYWSGFTLARNVPNVSLEIKYITPEERTIK